MEKENLQGILNRIQKELKAPKNQRNTFGNYNYRSCEDILEAVKPLLGEATLTINDEMVMLGDRFYVKATAMISNGDNVIGVSAFAREALEQKGMSASQLTGATSSYARKYALNGLLLIDDTKDDDHNNTHGQEVKPPVKSTIDQILDGEPLPPEPFDGSKPAEQQTNSRVCEKCGQPLKHIPAGTSKTTGKPYNAFWACPNKCR
jgi:hypothetical protein